MFRWICAPSAILAWVWARAPVAGMLARGLGLLTLDTKTGDGAEALYRSLGFHELGVIPDYALDPSEPIAPPKPFKSTLTAAPNHEHMVPKIVLQNVLPLLYG